MRTVPGPTDTVVIVGAGLGGLSAALHLAGAGRRVVVLERESGPGGRAGLLVDGGYRFDTGPSLLTLPEVLERCFAAVGEQLADRLTLHRLDPAYHARFADGSAIDVHTEPAAMAAEIEAVCGPHDAAGYLRFVDHLRSLYTVEFPHFIDRNLDSPRQLIGAPLARLAALGAFGRLGPKVASYFADDRLRRLFSFQSLYAGLAPARALALYSVITYLDCVGGVYFPAGGMHAIPRAMAAAATDHGVEIRYDTAATRVEVAGGRARAVITAGGERIPADVVLLNADLPLAYRDLLPPGYRPRRWGPARYSPSAVVLHLGVARAAPPTRHHTIDFGAAWDTIFDELDRGELMSDPSFLLTTPTITDPSLAPAGRHVHYALFPAPNLAAGRGRPVDWARDGDRYREHVLDTLEARGHPGLRDGIESQHLITPADWLAQGLIAGTPFAAAHTFGQTGPFRPATLDRRIENLLFAGCGTQPGVGVPMVLVSGHLAAQRVTGAMRR